MPLGVIFPSGCFANDMKLLQAYVFVAGINIPAQKHVVNNRVGYGQSY